MIKLIKQAFTLIELLVVITIIGILSGLIVVAMGGMTEKASIAKAQVFSNSLQNSLMLNLISEWKLDGNANDSWNGANNGTINGPTLSADCIKGSCYDFDGSNDYIAVNNSSSLNIINDFSIEFWYYKTAETISCATGDNRIVFMKADDYWDDNWYGIYDLCGDLDHFYFITRKADVDKGGDYNANFSLNKWNHIVFTKRGAITYFYVNGQWAAQGDAYADLNTSIENIYMMGNLGGSRASAGRIDEVRIYNAAIPTSQIKEQYYAGLNSLLASDNINAKEYTERINSIAQQ